MSLGASEQQAQDSIEATLTLPALGSPLCSLYLPGSPQARRCRCARLCTKAPSRAGSAGLRGLLELAVLRVSDVRGAVKLNTRQGIDARLVTLTTLAKAGQASWCSGEDWVQGGA